MSDDSDDPVMQLLATQRAVLGAVENLANQVEAMPSKVDAMSGVLAQPCRRRKAVRIGP
jgi:hypothetical protein